MYIDRLEVMIFMNIRNTEMKVLEVLWKEGTIAASKLYKILEQKIGWNKSTTYTVLKKCIEKGFIKRIEPDFLCEPLIQRQEIQKAKISDLVNEFFNNSKNEFLRTFLKENSLSEADVKELTELIERLK